MTLTSNMELFGPDLYFFFSLWASLVAGRAGNNPAPKAGDSDLIPGYGRSPGKGNGNLLLYSCLENSTDGGAWWVTIHEVTEELDTAERLNNSNSDDPT